MSLPLGAMGRSVVCNWRHFLVILACYFKGVYSFGQLRRFWYILHMYKAATCLHGTIEACSTTRVLGVLSSAFSLNASACQGACKGLRFK